MQPKPRRTLWTARQRRAILALLVAFWVVLCVRFFMNRAYLSADPDAQGPRAEEIADRLDPNTADWQALAAIPSLGEKRARAIVAYRERIGGPRVVFRTAADLSRVKGIGVATAANLKPFLIFPAAVGVADRPSTAP